MQRRDFMKGAAAVAAVAALPALPAATPSLRREYLAILVMDSVITHEQARRYARLAYNHRDWSALPVKVTLKV